MDLPPFTYYDMNMKILHARNVKLLTVEKTIHSTANNDSMNTNTVSISNQVKPTEQAINRVLVIISL